MHQLTFKLPIITKQLAGNLDQIMKGEKVKFEVYLVPGSRKSHEALNSKPIVPVKLWVDGSDVLVAVNVCEDDYTQLRLIDPELLKMYVTAHSINYSVLGRVTFYVWTKESLTEDNPYLEHTLLHKRYNARMLAENSPELITCKPIT